MLASVEEGNLGKERQKYIMNSETTPKKSVSWVLDIVLLVLFAVGLAFFVISASALLNSEYEAPPVPVNWIIAVILCVPSAALVLNQILSLSIAHGDMKPKELMARSFHLGWGLSVLLFAIFRFWVTTPYTLEPCPCPEFFFRDSATDTCLPCPGWSNSTCNDAECVCGSGQCDDSASRGTGTCFCDVNFLPNPETGICDTCTPNTISASTGDCSRCAQQFVPDEETGACTVCRVGYTGSNCQECANGFIRGENGNGVLCDPVSPGCDDDVPRFGSRCEPCVDCNVHGDVGATPMTNTRFKAEVLGGDSETAVFTFSGRACDFDEDCPSHNCRGECFGGSFPGKKCLEDDECGNGECRNRVCAAEYRVSDGACTCSRVGWFGYSCKKCPGFDSVMASTICGGGERGVCAEQQTNPLADRKLGCLCGKVGDSDLSYAGDLCEKIVNEEGEVVDCAYGFYGPNCLPCAGADIGRPCYLHGTCSDGIDGDGTCTCDSDIRPGGIGFFINQCNECAPFNFYSNQCRPCAGITRTTSPSHCASEPFFPFEGDTLTCLASCGAMTCDAGVEGSGTCTN